MAKQYSAPVDQKLDANKKYTATIETTEGTMTAELYPKIAPQTVNAFVFLAKDGFYEGVIFHRVIPGFMIQGGDPAGDGSGDPGYYFNDETDPALTFSVPGRLAMANAGPNTNGSQFFITEAPVPELDGKYTIFGQCDAHSVLLVASIARVQRNSKCQIAPPSCSHRNRVSSSLAPLRWIWVMLQWVRSTS